MQEEPIIQKSLFPISNENSNLKETNYISDDLTIENLKKESQKRPRSRNNSTNLVNKFKDNLIPESKKVCINEKSYSYKTVTKAKLTPVMKHYGTLKE